MKPAISIPSLFETVVTATGDELGQNLNFLHGHPLEIINTLNKMKMAGSNFPSERFPLIALFQDFQERRGTGGEVYAEVSLQMVIACLTTPSLNAAQRMEVNFIPTLYPIYDELLKQIVRSRLFLIRDTENEPKHIKTDRLFWGREGLYGNTGSIFDDYLDAIEIKNLDLKIKNQNC